MRACWLKWVGRDWSISADYIWLNYSDANIRALRVSIGLEGFALVAKMLVYTYVLREVARLLMRRKCQMGLLRK